MIIYLELLIVFYILFLIFFCAYEAFDRLSGGMIHKIEENDEKFAEKLSIWQQKNDPIRAVFKLLLFLLITFMGAFSYVVVKEFLAKNIQGPTPSPNAPPEPPSPITTHKTGTVKANISRKFTAMASPI